MKPTIGRIVHFRDGMEIFAAMIVHVYVTPAALEVALVNLVYWDEVGQQHSVCGVEMGSPDIITDQKWFWPKFIPTAPNVQVRLAPSPNDLKG